MVTNEDVIKGRLYLEFQQGYFKDRHIRKFSDLRAGALEEFYREQRRFVEIGFQEEINYTLIRIFVGRKDSQLVVKYQKDKDLEGASFSLPFNKDFREIVNLLKKDLGSKKVRFTRLGGLCDGMEDLNDEDLKNFTASYSVLENISGGQNGK